MSTIVSKEALLKMNISALRAYAREVGVYAPTTKRQAELIESIIAIGEGRLAPAEPSKKGRPVKHDTPISPIDENEILPDQLNADEVSISVDADENCDVVSSSPENTDGFVATGIVEVMENGYGFLRTANYHNSLGDIYVPPQRIKQFGLRSGDKLECKARIFGEKQAPSLIYIFKVNDVPCNELVRNVRFEDLSSKYPNERIRLESERTDYSLRLIDLVAPIGKGQRGLIVAAPKTGKTILLKKIAQAVRKNNPEIHMTVLLIDERPEEVTDFKESVDCEVVYSTFDQTPMHHIQVADLVIRNAKRRVEQGQDVMILLDSITRLGRAYNQTASQTGRTLSGGLDISALQEPKKFFGAGRNVENGSLTILATALVDTGSRMDDIIYEEFKGTGNMEICLDRKMSEKRIFPAVDISKSGTRREELLLTQKELEAMWLIRRELSRVDNVKATEELLDLLMASQSNDAFIDMLKIQTKKRNG